MFVIKIFTHKDTVYIFMHKLSGNLVL